MGALLHLDEKHGTAHAQRFLVPEGFWHRSAFAERDPLACQLTTERLCRRLDSQAAMPYGAVATKRVV
jgi:hypothetical protein